MYAYVLRYTSRKIPIVFIIVPKWKCCKWVNGEYIEVYNSVKFCIVIKMNYTCTYNKDDSHIHNIKYRQAQRMHTL